MTGHPAFSGLKPRLRLPVPKPDQQREAKMFKEFKEFAMRGNVVDMAVGIIIGGAFGTISYNFV